MGINFRNVIFDYDNSASCHTLKNINLSIEEQNEFITILGHTGSGKSTLTQLMNALILPHYGEIEIFDKTIRSKKNGKLKSIRSKVGLVFQFPEYQLFEDTVLKDIMFGPKNFGMSEEAAKAAALEACRLINLDESLLDRSPFSLSGGQMRKVAIAGILASKPQVLILDEPTVGLDPKGKRELMELLVSIQRETNNTIIIVTHDMSVVAQYAKRVLVLDEGELVYDGDKQDLFENIERLKKFNLDLPFASLLAVKLKERSLINYQRLPLTIEELFNVIERGGNDE